MSLDDKITLEDKVRLEKEANVFAWLTTGFAGLTAYSGYLLNKSTALIIYAHNNPAIRDYISKNLPLVRHDFLKAIALFAGSILGTAGSYVISNKLHNKASKFPYTRG